MIEHLELLIDSLLLDQENPRLGSTSSQSETLAGIVGLNPAHFQNLMGSIRDDGLDPGDSLYVISSENGSDFVVLEGNRRLSALKVLSNPDVLSGTDLPQATKKRLGLEATGFERPKIEPIRCVRFDGREEANDWIRRRHTGVAGGEGRITWKPLDIQRFSDDYTTIDVIEFVWENAGYSQDERQKAHSALGGGKSTNLTRLLESAAGRAHLGITVEAGPSRKTPILGADPEWALNVLRWIVDDILKDKVNSRQLNTATDIAKYFADLPPELQRGPNTDAPSPKAFKEIHLTENRAKPLKPTAPVRTKPVPRTRRTLAPKSHPFQTVNSEKLRMLLQEAGSLDIVKFPLSGAFLLRAIVESAVNDYLDANSLPHGNYGLTKKAEEIVNHIVSNNTASSTDFRAFRSYLLNSRSSCSIQSLNGFVHNRYQLPTADALRAGWESVIPVLTATYGKA